MEMATKLKQPDDIEALVPGQPEEEKKEAKLFKQPRN
jgi:hypothetical protein